MEEDKIVETSAGNQVENTVGIANPPATGVETTAEATEKKKEEDEEEGSWIGGLLMLAVIAGAIWALVHFNPSKEDHFEAIGESIADSYVEAAMNGYSLNLNTLSRIKYGSIGICSWTYVKRGGKFEIASVGACGYVLSLVE